MDKPIGSIVWTDLTVDKAPEIRDFYSKVVGWKHTAIPMGGHEDYVMIASGSEDGIAGICHAKGPNANMPPQWIIYVTVADVDAAAQLCIDQGGKVVEGPRMMGEHHFAVIQDPAGAVMGIISA